VKFVVPAVLLGVFLVVPSLALLWRDVRLARSGIRVDGVCVAVHRRTDSAKPSVTCEFEYTAADGRVDRVRSTPHHTPLAEVGERRTLLHLPGKPQQARAASDLHIGSAFFGVLVGVAAFTALVLFA
jgi:hypothetical protein